MKVTGAPGNDNRNASNPKDVAKQPATAVLSDPAFMAYFLQSMTLTFIQTTDASINILNQAIDDPE